MVRGAALFIDLENFFLSREKLLEGRPNESFNFAEELSELVSIVREKVGAGLRNGDERRMVLMRAYADFSARRSDRSKADRRFDYYLREFSRELMGLGIEPIQVFRFSQRSSKNAADMRLAMDATALMRENPAVDHVTIVSGDADFTPVVLEMKRHGVYVCVIGVQGSTMQQGGLLGFSDEFDFFDDLKAARAALEESGASKGVEDIARVRDALHTVLKERDPLVFAAVKALVSREMDAVLNPADFGCRNVGEFLKRNTAELGVHVYKGGDDWEVTAQAGDAVPADGDHTAHAYRRLLRKMSPKLILVPQADWQVIVRTVFTLLRDDAGNRECLARQDIIDRVVEMCESEIQDAGRSVRAALFQMYRAGCFERAPDDSGTAPRIRSWVDDPVRLFTEVRSADDLTSITVPYLVSELARRLADAGSGRIDAEVLANLLYDSEPSAEQREEIERLVGEGDPGEEEREQG